MKKIKVKSSPVETNDEEPNIEKLLKIGTVIQIVVYKGEPTEEAAALYRRLCGYNEMGTSFPIDNTPFRIMLSDVHMFRQYSDLCYPSFLSTEIVVKGNLV